MEGTRRRVQERPTNIFLFTDAKADGFFGMQNSRETKRRIWGRN